MMLPISVEAFLSWESNARKIENKVSIFCYFSDLFLGKMNKPPALQNFHRLNGAARSYSTGKMNHLDNGVHWNLTDTESHHDKAIIKRSNSFREAQNLGKHDLAPGLILILNDLFLLGGRVQLTSDLIGYKFEPLRCLAPKYLCTVKLLLFKFVCCITSPSLMGHCGCWSCHCSS